MLNSLNEQERAIDAMTERREQESAGEHARRNAEISADVAEETRARRSTGLPLGRLIRGDFEPDTVIILDPRPATVSSRPTVTADGEWRLNRERGWTKDIGYALQHVIRTHRYQVGRKGSKPNDPGWNECDCGWAGYWCEFEPHVADHLRSVVQAHQGTGLGKI